MSSAVAVSPSTPPELLDAVLEHWGALLCLKDARTGAYLRVNAAMARLLATTPEQAVGTSDNRWFDPAVVTALRAADQTALAQAGPLVSDHAFEFGGERREFTVLRLLLSAGATGAPGEPVLASVWTDKAPERRQQAQLAQAMAQVEALQRALQATQAEAADAPDLERESWLGSRTRFEDQLRRELDLSTREQREFALVFIEIDHDAEAKVLPPAGVFESIGRLLRSNTRAMDASCRVDDMRFAVLLSGVGLATAHSRMEGLRRQCATQLVVDGSSEAAFTVSMGVASFPHTAQSHDELVAASERALSDARRRGGNRVALATIRFEGA